MLQPPASKLPPQAGLRQDSRSSPPAVRPDDHVVPAAASASVLTPRISLVERFAEIMGDAPVAAFIKDAEGRYLYINAYVANRFGAWFGPDWLGKTDEDVFPSGTAEQIRADDARTLLHRSFEVYTQDLPFEDGPHTFLTFKFPVERPSGRPLLGGVAIDTTAGVREQTERDQLATVIEQVAESVVIADLDGTITYVNPAFERVTGYSRDEAVGQNPRIISSGLHAPGFFEAMWAALTNGEPWVADFVNRRKDGSLFNEEAVISPIRDDAGNVSSYVAVKRDVTQERAGERRAAEMARERALIGDTLRGLGRRDTPEHTAQAVCRQVVGLSGMVTAQLVVFELDGRAQPIGFAVPGRSDPPLRRLPERRSREFHERALLGPWVEHWVDRPSRPRNPILKAAGVCIAGYAPVRYGDELVGLLIVGAGRPADAATMSDKMPAIVEFADLAGALIGRDIADRLEVRVARDRIRSMIDQEAFHPVFQPIVELDRGAIVGFESLTRFDDLVAPDGRFAEAEAVGLGRELEIATLQAALRAERDLPADAWLNLNVSPDLILAGEPLRSILAGTHRSLVLEVTEHLAIDDYAAFRAALAGLGAHVRLAVDDAGAGFASLRHIVELRPAFVKLDRSLVAGVDTDEALQAMIVGLLHFALSTGCRLIAEGIETERERSALWSLGIRLGQGYLLGRPAPPVKRRRDLGPSRVSATMSDAATMTVASTLPDARAYFRVAATPRFRAMRRRSMRQAAKHGMLLVAASGLLDSIWLGTTLHPDAALLVISPQHDGRAARARHLRGDLAWLGSTTRAGRLRRAHRGRRGHRHARCGASGDDPDLCGLHAAAADGRRVDDPVADPGARRLARPPCCRRRRVRCTRRQHLASLAAHAVACWCSWSSPPPSASSGT